MNESQLSQSLKSGQRTMIYHPGSIVRVTQQIAQRAHVYSIAVVGKVLRQERQESGSWFARNKSNRLWLDRLIVEKKDGEQVVLNLDGYSRIDVLEGPSPQNGDTPLIRASQDRASSLT